MEITKKQYSKMPESFWVGKRVRLLREIRNGHSTFEKGKEMTIDRKYCGFGLVADERRENGCIKSISRVSINDVRLIKQSEKADKTCATKHVIPPKSKDSGILPKFT